MASRLIAEVPMKGEYLGGLKAPARVVGLSVHEPTKTLAVAVSRLDGNVWDGCVELWSLPGLLAVHDGTAAATASSPALMGTAGGACVGRVASPCGVSSLAWLNGGSGGSGGSPRSEAMRLGRSEGPRACQRRAGHE